MSFASRVSAASDMRALVFRHVTPLALVTLAVTIACVPAVPATIDGPHDAGSSGPAHDAQPEPAPIGFDIGAALDGSELRLLGLDRVKANRPGRADMSFYSEAHTSLHEQGLRALLAT
ncbi:MAG: hypothetical protein AB1Z98_13400 [Nannocystaceae bacterium]